jgi:hypothetical protein
VLTKTPIVVSFFISSKFALRHLSALRYVVLQCTMQSFSLPCLGFRDPLLTLALLVHPLFPLSMFL